MKGQIGRSHVPIPVGSVFGRLTIQRFIGVNSGGRAEYECRCECGAIVPIIAALMRDGSTRSCGCIKREQSAEECKARLTTHGLSRHPLFHTWNGIIDRCCNPNAPAFGKYGGRGINVCDRWKRSPQAFIDDMGPKPGPQYSIDRIKNDGDYEPSNCRWATKREQARNRTSRNVYLLCDGKTLLMVEWSEITGLSMNTIHARLKRGWSDEKALKTPLLR